MEENENTEKLWTTTEVATFTKLSARTINKMCRDGKLPYIPSKPHLFVPSAVRDALKKMQRIEVAA